MVTRVKGDVIQSLWRRDSFFLANPFWRNNGIRELIFKIRDCNLKSSPWTQSPHNFLLQGTTHSMRGLNHSVSQILKLQQSHSLIPETAETPEHHPTVHGVPANLPIHSLADHLICIRNSPPKGSQAFRRNQGPLPRIWPC